jgi:xylan 1,4-beta-xylosidase
MDIHITEFNTAYVPDCPLHDTNRNASYIAYLLSRLGEDNESYSYWTFGDVFEEKGVPYTPFHGGFGLVANGLIPKPTFWVFKFFMELQGKCVCKTKELIVLQKADGKYCGVAWNLSYENSEETLQISCELPSTGKDYCLLQKIVDEKYCNPLKLWHDLGEPSNPYANQLELIRDAAKPLVISNNFKALNDRSTISLKLERNAVIYFELFATDISSDRGYDYNKVMNSLSIVTE